MGNESVFLSPNHKANHEIAYKRTSVEESS